MLRRILLSVAILVSLPAAAETVQNFDAPGTPYSLVRHSIGAPAAVLGGGPSGNFLRLVFGNSPLSLNTVGFDRTDAGAFCKVTVDFDFRITPGGGSSHGLGLLLLATAAYGASGSPATNEEPSASASVGVGFDIFQNSGEINGNHFSLHFDGDLLATVDVTGSVDLDGSAGQFIHAQIVVEADATSGAVSVRLTPPGGSVATVVDALPIPGLDLYEGRLQFGARSGSQSASHDLDNIHVSYESCPEIVGAWGDAIPIPIVAIHADLLPSGQVLIWDRDDAAPGPQPPYLFDPIREVATAIADPGHDLFCSGHSYLPDGRLLVTGGHDEFNDFGLPFATLYDSSDSSWTTLPDEMNAGRWYPTNLTLPSGDTLVVGGSIETGLINELPQVFEIATQGWRDLDDALRPVPLYSFFHLAPNGMAFDSGPEPLTRYLDTTGNGEWIDVAPTGSIFRSAGSSVLYEPGKVLLVGGGDPPTRTVQRIDLNRTAPTWEFVESMDFARRQLNATILADGSVIVTGGTGSAGFNVVDDAVFAGELWDPNSESWTTLSAAEIPRIYHSFSLLLPDARLLTGGSGHPPGVGPPGDMDHFDVEIYSPPYLFRGSRPTIAAAPSSFGHAESFLVETPDAAQIAAVHLIRLGSVTHAFDQSQSFSRLRFSKTARGLDVTAPTSGVEAPPGPYMLFVLNDEGVPSVASIVRLLPNAGRLADDALRLDRAPGGNLALYWQPSCAIDDFDHAIYQGSLGDFDSHAPHACSTSGATSAIVAPGAGDRYYLVVPRNTVSEGSYGTGAGALERPPAADPCLPRSIGACR